MKKPVHNSNPNMADLLLGILTLGVWHFIALIATDKFIHELAVVVRTIIGVALTLYATVWFLKVITKTNKH